MKKAATMLEMIMVIVVLGIVASIGSEIILNLYNNYIRSRAVYQLEAQTELTLEQIARRLQYRIKASTIARTQAGAFVSLAGANNAHSILEWIGYSNESFIGTPNPGWSGFIDLDHPQTSRANGTLRTHDSNLAQAGAIMTALTGGRVALGVGSEAALIFHAPTAIADFGWGAGNVNADGAATLLVRQNAANPAVFNIAEPAANLPNEISEHYYLAHSAYAIVPSAFGVTNFNLILRYNYQPWLGNNFTNGTAAILAQNVSLFQFKQDDEVIRLKLCLHDNALTGTGDRIAICKERVVY